MYHLFCDAVHVCHQNVARDAQLLFGIRGVQRFHPGVYFVPVGNSVVEHIIQNLLCPPVSLIHHVFDGIMLQPKGVGNDLVVGESELDDLVIESVVLKYVIVIVKINTNAVIQRIAQDRINRDIVDDRSVIQPFGADGDALVVERQRNARTQILLHFSRGQLCKVIVSEFPPRQIQEGHIKGVGNLAVADQIVDGAGDKRAAQHGGNPDTAAVGAYRLPYLRRFFQISGKVRISVERANRCGTYIFKIGGSKIFADSAQGADLIGSLCHSSR